LARPSRPARRRSKLFGKFCRPQLASAALKKNFPSNDFYQTASSVNVALYLKKIDKERARVDLTENTITFDLPTSDNKRFQDTYNLFAPIDPEKSSFRVLGTKLELTLVKADGTSWPVLRNDDKWSGQRIQIGNAGRA
jgi:hypothetical protein